MLAMHAKEPLTHDQAQPDEERQIRSSLVIPKLGRSIEIGFLKDIGRVDAPLQAMIEPQLNHPPQSIPMGREKTRQCSLISAARPLDKVSQLFGRVGHLGSLPLARIAYPPSTGDTGDRFTRFSVAK
jgi:hypothetical protein